MSNLDDILDDLADSIVSAETGQMADGGYVEEFYPQHKQRIKDLFLDLIRDCQEYQSTNFPGDGYAQVIEVDELRQKVEAL